jgi:hypothetical protein
MGSCAMGRLRAVAAGLAARAKSPPRPHVFSAQQQASDDSSEPLLPKDGEDFGLRHQAVDRRPVPSQQLSNLIEQ